MTIETAFVLALICVVAAAAYWAGRRSAESYLSASQAVADIARASVEQANDYAATLDTQKSEMASLRGAIEASTKSSEERSRAVEDALLGLFQGLERAGIARAPRATGRQVGESRPDA